MENFCVFFSNRSWGNHYSPCHSPSCLKKWAGKERKSWRRKKKRKNQIHYLKVGGDFCYGKTCNIPLTQLSPPIRWEGCVPARCGLGDRPISFLWWRDMVVAPCPSSRVLQQLQDKAGKRREMEEMVGIDLSQCQEWETRRNPRWELSGKICVNADIRIWLEGVFFQIKPNALNSTWSNWQNRGEVQMLEDALVSCDSGSATVLV